MEWINTDNELPTYYECVNVRLTTGEEIEAWRASNGEYDIWTKFGTNEVFYHEDIKEWRRYKLEEK